MGGQVQRAKPYTYQPFCKAGPLHAGLLQALHMRAHLKCCRSEHHRHMHLSPRQFRAPQFSPKAFAPASSHCKWVHGSPKGGATAVSLLSSTEVYKADTYMS